MPTFKLDQVGHGAYMVVGSIAPSENEMEGTEADWIESIFMEIHIQWPGTREYMKGGRITRAMEIDTKTRECV